MSEERSVRIWVDGDACPRAVKEILYRAAERRRILLTVVANRPLRLPRSPFLRSLRVPQGFDRADREILERMEAGDLVVTGDLPLASEVIERGGFAIGMRGEELDEENVGERLAMRDLAEQLRSAGIETGGPDAPGRAEKQAFANALDRWLARHAPQPDG